MKRIISALLLVSLILSTVSVSANDETRKIELIFDESFDYTKDGEKADSGDTYEKNSRVRVATVQGYTGKALEYESLKAGDLYYEISVNGAKDNCIFEFDFMIDKLNDNGMSIVFKDKAYTEVAVMSISSLGELKTADGSVITTLNPHKFYNICANVDLNNHNADIYINHKKKASGVAFSRAEFEGLSVLRISMAGLVDNSRDKIYLDNVKIYDAPLPIFRYEEINAPIEVISNFVGSGFAIASESETVKYMDGTVAMYVGSNRIAIDGEAEYIDKNNKNVRAYTKDGVTFIPVRTMAEALDATVEYKENTKSAILTLGEKSITFTEGKTDFISDGKSYTMNAAPEITEGRMCVPVRYVSEFFGKKVTYDKSGMIVIADRENFFTLREDLGVFRNLAGNLVFDPPKGEDAINTIKTKYANNQHPRIYFDRAEFEDLKREIGTNSLMAGWYANVVSNADKYLTLPVQEYKIPDGIRLYDSCNIIKERVRDLAFVYLMTGDEAYAAKAMAEIENACNYKDWNPYHFLDTSEMIIAFSVAYDWLYDYMSQEQRDMMKTALIEKGLKPALQDYTDDPERVRSFYWTMIGNKEPSNWTIICNASVVLAALAFGDEIDMGAQLLDYAFENIKFPVLMYGPDGAWYEGPSYWGFTTVNYVDFVDSIINVLGDDFGYLDVPGTAEAGHYFYTAQKFNIHDSGTVTGVTYPWNPELLFFADKKNDPGLANAKIDAMKNNKAAGTIRDILFYNYKAAQSGEMAMKKDYYFRDTEIALMTNGWEGMDAIYAGLHAGKVIAKHSHMDAGQFVIDGYGTRYAMDLGKDDYNLAGSQWDRYRYRAEGHNTLVINPDAGGGQFTLGNTKIDRFESGESSAFTVVDLTSAYGNQAHSIKRGMKLANNRSMIILQDEMNLFAPSEVYWFMHTQCPITILEDGKTAKIEGKYRDMYVYLLQDVDGVFSVMDAKPLPTSPTVAGQQTNDGFQKLCFKADNVSEMTLSIAFSFEPPYEEMPELYRPEVVPIDKWTLEETEAVEKPVVTDIRINGETADGFSPDNLGYSVRVKHDEATPAIEAFTNDENTVSVQMPSELPGNAVIKVVSKKDENVKNYYVVKIDKEILSEGPEGTMQIPIAAVEASDIPQPENSPENSFDGSLETRWSAQGKNHIIYDLGSVKNVSYVGLAVYNGNARKQYFDIYTSKDGVDFEKVYSGETSGTTVQNEVFAIKARDARFVKIACKGTSVGDWNSITEAKIYGK